MSKTSSKYALARDSKAFKWYQEYTHARKEIARLNKVNERLAKQGRREFYEWLIPVVVNIRYLKLDETDEIILMLHLYNRNAIYKTLMNTYPGLNRNGAQTKISAALHRLWEAGYAVTSGAFKKTWTLTVLGRRYIEGKIKELEQI